MRRAALLAPLLALVLAAGCGDGGGESREERADAESSHAAVAQAAVDTTEAGSSRMSFALTMDGIAPEPVEMTGEGVFDSKRRLGRMTLRIPAVAAEGGPSRIDAIMQGVVVYMRVPQLRQARPDLKPWLKIDVQKLAASQGLGSAGLEQLNQTDPTAALAYLRAVSGAVQEVGEEEVRGVTTTHYRMTVDLRKVGEQAPEQRRSVERLVQQAGVREVPTEVWIDEDGLVRRMKANYENMRFADGRSGRMEMSMELYDFGVDVDVEPPPAGQVTDIGELLGAAER